MAAHKGDWKTAVEYLGSTRDEDRTELATQ